MAEAELVSVSDLKEWDRNPRKIDKGRMDNLKRSMQADPDFLRLRPILALPDGTVYAGNQRLKAARSLGLETVWAIREDVDEPTMKARALRDNNQWGEWEMADLAKILEEIPDDLQDLTGFTDKELSKLKDTQLLEEITEDEPPEPPKEPKSKPGDLYQLGNHRLLCGDSTKLEDIERLMDGQKADMVLTDPPYNTGMTNKSQSEPNKRLGQKSGSAWLSHMFDDAYTPEEWETFLADVFANYVLATKGEAAFYVCIDWRRVADIRKHMEPHMKVSNVIVWDKVVHGLGSDYKYTYELIVVGKKGNPEIHNRFGEEYRDIWHVQRKVGRNEDHATAKPIQLCAIPIRHASKQDDIVLDLFGGSGSTLIAAEQLGRKCYMMELDPRYVDVIVKRWENLTGNTAVLLNG